LLYLDLFRSLATHKAPYLLVGGLAVNLYGILRLTMDVDLAVKFTPESVSGLETMCRELALAPIQSLSRCTSVQTPDSGNACERRGIRPPFQRVLRSDRTPPSICFWKPYGTSMRPESGG
jgi:hypothetical protein